MLTSFLVALQFLSIVRIRRTLPFDDTTLGRAGAFFPAVGLLLGGVVCAVDWMFSLLAAPTLTNVLVVVALAVLSRGLHLDGVADSADGLCGGTDVQRRLAIMKDSRIGTFGALALLLVVLVKLRALDLLVGEVRTLALLLSPMLGRWSCVLMAAAAPPARADGLGAMFIRGVRWRECALAGGFTLLVSSGFAGGASLAFCAAVTGAALGFTRYCTRRLGGVTGDTMGAVGEVSETAALCLFTLLSRGS